MFKWLEQALNDAGDKPVLIFTHIPMENTWGKEDRERWLNLIHAHNVKAMFAGHLHQDQLVWEDDIPEYVVPPVAAPDQLRYRIYNYDNGRIGYKTINLRLLPEQLNAPTGQPANAPPGAPGPPMNAPPATADPNATANQTR